MLFGDKIKELRDEQGLLQRQLAAFLEIDTPMFSKLNVVIEGQSVSRSSSLRSIFIRMKRKCLPCGWQISSLML